MESRQAHLHAFQLACMTSGMSSGQVHHTQPHSQITASYTRFSCSHHIQGLQRRKKMRRPVWPAAGASPAGRRRPPLVGAAVRCEPAPCVQPHWPHSCGAPARRRRPRGALGSVLAQGALLTGSLRDLLRVQALRHSPLAPRSHTASVAGHGPVWQRCEP